MVMSSPHVSNYQGQLGVYNKALCDRVFILSYPFDTYLLFGINCQNLISISKSIASQRHNDKSLQFESN